MIQFVLNGKLELILSYNKVSLTKSKKIDNLMRIRRKVEKIITQLREININIEKRVNLLFNKLEDLDIIITNEETVPFRYNQKSILILIPFNLKNYNLAKKSFFLQAPPYLMRRYIKKIKKNNKSYLTFPENTNVSDSELEEMIIFELINGYDINRNNFSKNEWNYIKNTKEWNFCKIQKLRELILGNINNSV